MARPKSNKGEIVPGATPPEIEPENATDAISPNENEEDKVISTVASVKKGNKSDIPIQESYKVIIKGRGFTPEPQIISGSVLELIKNKKGIKIEYVD